MFKAPQILTVQVNGEGIIAEMYAGIISVFTPFTKSYEIDPVPCLPDPSIPNVDKYLSIGNLLIEEFLNT